MHAMAPGNSGALHAGHSLGVEGGGALLLLPSATDKAGERGDAAEGATGRVTTAAPAPPAVLAAAAAEEADGDWLPPTRNGLWQLGQRNCLPAELSATCIGLWQCGQRITNGMGVVLLLRPGERGV